LGKEYSFASEEVYMQLVETETPDIMGQKVKSIMIPITSKDWIMKMD